MPMEHIFIIILGILMVTHRITIFINGLLQSLQIYLVGSKMRVLTMLKSQKNIEQKY